MQTVLLFYLIAGGHDCEDNEFILPYGNGSYKLPVKIRRNYKLRRAGEFRVIVF